MSIVTGSLDIRHLEGENWLLLAPLSVVRPLLFDFDIPAGFVTDLASVPRAARWLIPKGRNESLGAVVHDFIYRGHVPGITRAQADRLFLEIMEQSGVGWWRRQAIYRAVRAGGWASWKGKPV